MIYFTSDLHLGHANVITMNNRPFKNVDEMNKTIISNYNALISREDTVYILGDLTFKIPLDEANKLISELNGKKILVKGNHDRSYDESLFEKIVVYDEIAEYGEHIILMHYPIMDWKRKFRGSIHLHGHIHSIGMEYNLQCKKDSILRYDVGVDANNFYPISIKAIRDFIKKQS